MTNIVQPQEAQADQAGSCTTNLTSLPPSLRNQKFLKTIFGFGFNLSYNPILNKCPYKNKSYERLKYLLVNEFDAESELAPQFGQETQFAP